MDPLSVTASVIAVIQISSQIFGVCQTYYKEVKDARNDMGRLRDEVMSLQDVSTNSKDLRLDPSSAKLSIIKLLGQPDRPLQQCQKDPTELLLKLNPGQRNNKIKKVGKGFKVAI
jgi:ankyrin repeat domain-containing protein 50